MTNYDPRALSTKREDDKDNDLVHSLGHLSLCEKLSEIKAPIAEHGKNAVQPSALLR